MLLLFFICFHLKIVFDLTLHYFDCAAPSIKSPEKNESNLISKWCQWPPDTRISKLIWIFQQPFFSGASLVSHLVCVSDVRIECIWYRSIGKRLCAYTCKENIRALHLGKTCLFSIWRNTIQYSHYACLCKQVVK